MNTFTVVNVFEDDHELCCNFNYNGKPFSLWWSNLAYIGAFEYPDSPKSQVILTNIASVLDTMIANGPKSESDYDSDADDYRHTDYGFLDYGHM